MLRDLPSIAATTCILGLSLFGLPLAVSQTASAETAAQHKGCRIDAKTGRPVPSRIASNESPRSGRKVTRVPCPSPAQSAEQKTVPALENVWLDAGALLLKAPPPVAGGWWVKGEALVWSVKSAPLPPTLTTFAPGSLSAITEAGGDVGVAGTTILSPDNMRFDPLAGGRFTLGHWLDPNQSLGVEGAGFFLGSRNAGFSETSGGAPPLRVPFTNVPPGAGFPLGNSSFVLADPGVAAGGQVISSSLQFWGAEGNAIFHAFNARTVNVSLLAGVRYLNLSEGLTIASTETLLPPFAGNTFTGTDSFGTRNQFFGGQVGAKAETQYGRFDGSLLGKLAFGDNYQTVSVNGSSAVSGFGFPPGSVTPGGIFAQGTNIGQRSRNQFAVVPKVQLQVGYKLPNGIHVFVGYDFLYMSNIFRPGDQIDTTLNLTGNPTIAPGTTLTGAARPAPQFNNSSFWAQGVDFGLSYDF